MASTVRCLKGLVTKRNDAAMDWLQDSIQALTDAQVKESARRIRTSFDETPETTEEEEDHQDKYIEMTQATIMKLHERRTRSKKEEIAQGTSPIDEGASKTFVPRTATTLLLRRKHVVSSLNPKETEGSWKHSNSKPQHNEVRDWMQIMNQHFETLTQKMENGFKTVREEIKRHHEKAQSINTHTEHQTPGRTMQTEDQAKEGYVKNCRQRRMSSTTSQKSSNTAIRVQKQNNDKERKSAFKGAQERQTKRIFTDIKRAR
ncbi:unnamed protein product [Cylicocyclus nassatus]|uniref:Uncharacterized protein n=1 Tax=Cylicocyclus nassatus TaxID=53992 RepID=A0AA36H8B1_CYLNA|nr:unnamed protein product [Cylicocyclus nassatus]